MAEIIERWFVLSYDATTKAYKRSDIKEDIAEFLLLLKIKKDDKETKDLKIRTIESYSDSTIHFGFNTSEAIKDMRGVVKAIEDHQELKKIDYSLNLLSYYEDTKNPIKHVKPKQPLKNDFDQKVAALKKDLNIK